MRITDEGIENSWILYGLLLLSCMNFMGRGPIVFFLFSLYGFLKSEYKIWDSALTPYLFISLGALFSSLIFYDFKEIIKVSLFFLSCYSGFVTYISAVDKEIFIKRLFLSASVGALAFLLLTYHLNFNILNLPEGSRVLVNYWRMDSNLPATCLGLISSIIIIFSFYLIFCDKNIYIKIIGISFLLLCLYVNIKTATRTPIVLFIVIYLILFLIFFKDLNLNRKIGLICILIILGVLFLNNLIVIYQESSLAVRFDEVGLETGRWDITKKYFEEMLNHLWGGRYIYNKVGRLAHNFILEGYDLYGILFFIPLLLVCIAIIMRSLKLCRRVNESNSNLILLGLSIGLFMSNLLEPTITGYPQILWILFMTDGIIIAEIFYEDYYDIEE